MTIDEVIDKYKEKAKFFKQTTNIAYALELEQIVEWFEELKSYRASVFSGDMTQAMLKEEYCRAIDDFIDMLKAERTQCYNFDDSEHNNPIKCVWWNDIEEIAEQLNGGKEENVNNE